MKTSADWIDQVKRRHGLDSDYAAAKLLGVSTSHISHYRNGRSTMDAYMAARVAELLDVEPLRVIASAEAERARDPDRKDFWKRLAACVLVAAGAGAITPPNAEARSLHNENLRVETAGNTHCALKRRKKKPAKSTMLEAAADFGELVARTVGIRTHRLL